MLFVIVIFYVSCPFGTWVIMGSPQYPIPFANQQFFSLSQASRTSLLYPFTQSRRVGKSLASPKTFAMTKSYECEVFLDIFAASSVWHFSQLFLVAYSRRKMFEPCWRIRFLTKNLPWINSKFAFNFLQCFTFLGSNYIVIVCEICKKKSAKK